jgi:hypothetical protein
MVKGELQSALADRYTIERELGRGGMATSPIPSHPVVFVSFRPVWNQSRSVRLRRLATSVTRAHGVPSLDPASPILRLLLTRDLRRDGVADGRPARSTSRHRALGHRALQGAVRLMRVG